MAIRPEHDKSIKARFERATSGMSGFMSDFKEVHGKVVGNNLGDVVLSGMIGIMGGTLGGFVLGLPTGVVVKEAMLSSNFEVQQIEYGIENEIGLEAIQTNSGTYALFHNHGEYALYEYDRVNDELDYIPSSGDVMEIMDRLTDGLENVSVQYAEGEFTSSDLPSFVTFSQITENYVDDGSIVRGVESLVVPDEARDFGRTLADAAQDWEAAFDVMRSSPYGYTHAEQSEFTIEQDAGDLGRAVFGSIIVLGAVGGLFAPTGYVAANTISRRRQEKADKKKQQSLAL